MNVNYLSGLVFYFPASLSTSRHTIFILYELVTKPDTVKHLGLNITDVIQASGTLGHLKNRMLVFKP